MGSSKWNEFRQGFTGMSAEELKEHDKKNEEKKKKGSFFDRMFGSPDEKAEQKQKKKDRYKRTKKMLGR